MKMTGAEALRRFEQRLIPARTVAGGNAEWDVYRKQWLPTPDDESDGMRKARAVFEASVHQGFDAGYDAAMAQVRTILGSVQSEALRDPDPFAKFPTEMAEKVPAAVKRLRSCPHSHYADGHCAQIDCLNYSSRCAKHALMGQPDAICSLVLQEV